MRINLSSKQLCDLELLLVGAFSPVFSYLDKNDYHSVCEAMHLESGEIWPIPVTFDVTLETLKSLKQDSILTLCDSFGRSIATLNVKESWRVDKEYEAQSIYGTSSSCLLYTSPSPRD